MRQHTWVLATPSRTAPPVPAVPVGQCLVSIPADAGAIDPTWLRPVIVALLSRHEKVMILLTSELLAYEGSSVDPGNGNAQPGATVHDRISQDTMARWLEIEEVKLSLKSADHPRVHIASWAHFTDARFAELWRMLLTAFARDRHFRRDVLALSRESSGHAERADILALPDRALSLSRLETLAMRLRICEVGGYHYEYGFGDDELLTRHFYTGAYAAEGLSVEALVGHVARRQFVTL
ncbi:MAG: hypothetical protein Q8K55_01870 [Gemmatimonadaceae bacterium]|nr:hypothetical protein [Gemmatimonadaceae bacterium]